MALEKPGGGVRPIAVGCTLRRLVAKIAGQLVVDEMAELLSPRHLGMEFAGVQKQLCMQAESTYRIFPVAMCS